MQEARSPFSGSPSRITREAAAEDYRTAYRSRQASTIGRREVLSGKAKFGIFGGGKEVAQVAMARSFRNGDIRSGYYRDQTFMFAAGMSSLEEFFAQLYADTDPEHDPASAGRQMNAHFATRMLDAEGRWRDLTAEKHSSGDISPTGSQMPRLVGLAYASKLYRRIPELASLTRFSRNGDEVAWGTIGNASCAEGMFWEAINAAGVLGVPMLVSIWDDGYGISVPNELQITKGNLSEILAGFQRRDGEKQGYDIYRVAGWDYPALIDTYARAAATARNEHVPAIVHVVDLTQPEGHSTSGSHERYKSKERLAWEREYDSLRKMREWLVAEDLASTQELDQWEAEDLAYVREIQRRAWQAYREPIERELKEFVSLVERVRESTAGEAREGVEAALSELLRVPVPMRRDLQRTALDVLVASGADDSEAAGELVRWRRDHLHLNDERYATHLLSESAEAAMNVPAVAPSYPGHPQIVNGFEIINGCFHAAMQRNPNLVIKGEDVGRLGDVNQGCAGLQEKFGALRVSDTGIRENTIIGQAIGMAMRGLRPIVEIQYLDYVLYALQIMSDDLATLRWRTAGGQKSPVIIRTRGHRLEGIWHAGSPMGGIISLVRGMHVCVPRNMTQASGFYNTLLLSDDPAIVVEVLNGYRSKEPLPENVGEMTVPLGVPEVLREGKDATIVTYGACCRIALEAADLLARKGIDAEVIDVQTLLPFDREGVIVRSLSKTSRIVFVDEDVPGGATAFMMRQVLERDGGYEWLDSEPRTVTGTEHRPAYGSDGDYWSKPGRESIFEAVYGLMHEAAPAKFPPFYG
jgi:pyruvate/2-oxoglutarate/acetoin dehydrogenase E1 component/TPP-dependent pyruvate/acetoin dehydrogenase alpha subunit